MGYVHNEVLVSHLFPILYPEFISVFDLMWIQQKHRFYFLIQSVSLCLSLGKMNSLVLRAINKWCLLVSYILLLWYSIFSSLFSYLSFIYSLCFPGCNLPLQTELFLSVSCVELNWHIDTD